MYTCNTYHTQYISQNSKILGLFWNTWYFGQTGWIFCFVWIRLYPIKFDKIVLWGIDFWVSFWLVLLYVWKEKKGKRTTIIFFGGGGVKNLDWVHSSPSLLLQLKFSPSISLTALLHFKYRLFLLPKWAYEKQIKPCQHTSQNSLFAATHL